MGNKKAIVSIAVLHHHSSSLQQRSHSFHLLSFPHCCGDHFNQPDPGSTWSQLNAFLSLTYTKHIKGTGPSSVHSSIAARYLSFCYVPHSCATCVIFDPQEGLTNCVKGINCICSIHLWTGQLFCSLLWTVWMFGWLGSCLSMVHCWLGPPCVCGGVFHCLEVQVGD